MENGNAPALESTHRHTCSCPVSPHFGSVRPAHFSVFFPSSCLHSRWDFIMMIIVRLASQRVACTDSAAACLGCVASAVVVVVAHPLNARRLMYADRLVRAYAMTGSTAVMLLLLLHVYQPASYFVSSIKSEHRSTCPWPLSWCISSGLYSRLRPTPEHVNLSSLIMTKNHHGHWLDGIVLNVDGCKRRTPRMCVVNFKRGNNPFHTAYYTPLHRKWTKVPSS